jgi:hypothetical protein
VDVVAFFQQQFGEVGTILTGDAGDECALGHLFILILGPEQFTSADNERRLLSCLLAFDTK